MNSRTHHLRNGAHLPILKLILSSALFCLFTAAAQAQLAAYGKFDYSRYSQLGTTTSFYGPGVGVYDDFLHADPLAPDSTSAATSLPGPTSTTATSS